MTRDKLIDELNANLEALEREMYSARPTEIEDMARLERARQILNEINEKQWTKNS
jgi:chaperonin cofactor prefoldin